MTIKAFKTVDFSSEDVQLLQIHIQQYLQQFRDYPSIAIGTENMRLPKPAFKYNSSTSVIIPASSSSPVFAFIGDKFYKSTASITCNLALSGFGGLDSGALAASTAYYLYLVVKDGVLGAIASLNNPATAGPKDFPIWSYIGAFVTRSTTIIGPFMSNNGLYIDDDEFFVISPPVNSTTPVSKTITPYPVGVVKHHWGRISYSATAAGRDGHAIGANLSTSDGLKARCVVAGQFSMNSGFVPNLDDGKIWFYGDNAADTVAWSSYGWQENPQEWP